MTQQAEQAALTARNIVDRTTLFWSERGEVCCALHSPFPGSDTWIWQRWSLMNEEERREWTRLLGHAPKCEVCE